MALTKNQENKITMFKAVDSLLDNNAPIVALIPALGTKHTELKTRISGISTKSQEKGEALLGKATDKYDAENRLVTATLKVAGPLFAYGADTSNNEIMEAAHVTQSSLRRLRDTDFPIRCKTVADMATANIVVLTATYGVNAADVTEINDAKTAFDTALGQRESASNAKSGAGGTLKSMFRDTLLLLETMDGLVASLKVSQQQFYMEYQFARVIRDLGKTGHNRSGNLAPSETKLLASSDFTDSTNFTLKNPGTTILHYCTGADEGSGCSAANGKVNPGETIIRTSLELGLPGSTFLKVTNDGAGNGSYEVSW